MRERHPRFKRSRVDQLGVFEKGGVAPTPEQRRADAEELADRMAESGDSILDIAKAWHAEDPRIDLGYLHRLRRDFEAELFHEGALARRPPDRRRSSHAIDELYSLAIRLSAPGTGERALVQALNRLLVQRGLPPYPEDRQMNAAARVAKEHGTLYDRGAAITAEVVAEYARGARAGTGEEAILAALQRDYPTIDAFKLSTYRRMWQENPGAYPALKPFFRRGALAFRGRGERLPRRYRGGWDVERALLAAAQRDRALAEELAHYSEYARIPASLPLLDEMVASLGGKRPLNAHNVLMVSHLLGSSVPLARALARAGALAKSTIVVGTPYGTNPAVRRTLEAEGFQVRVPELSPLAYRAAVEKAVADMVERYRRNHKPVVVLDDGGLVAEILHTDPRYKQVRHAFKIVEQTTRGITAAEAWDLKGPIVSVAGSESKKAEAEFIGRAVARKLVQGLGRLNKRVKGARVTVVGYGNVGRAIARELALLEAEVVVVEPSETRAAEADDAGFEVRALEDALDDADLVVGASGTTSIKLEHLRRLRSGTVVVSASSKRLEIEMERLEAWSSWRKPILANSPLVRLPTARYRLGNREITVLGDGWPVNFDGDVEDIDPEEIQLTRAAMFAGALQAASIHINHAKNKGIVPLDPSVDDWILRRFRELRRTAHRPGIRDPDRWMDVIRDVHKSMSG
jgi:S-adenosylhomocysteine hydrolase